MSFNESDAGLCPSLTSNLDNGTVGLCKPIQAAKIYRFENCTVFIFVIISPFYIPCSLLRQYQFIPDKTGEYESIRNMTYLMDHRSDRRLHMFAVTIYPRKSRLYPKPQDFSDNRHCHLTKNIFEGSRGGGGSDGWRCYTSLRGGSQVRCPRDYMSTRLFL